MTTCNVSNLAASSFSVHNLLGSRSNDQDNDLSQSLSPQSLYMRLQQATMKSLAVPPSVNTSASGTSLGRESPLSVPHVDSAARQLSRNKKQRVLCNRCGRTYCDKGALNIHISAVHERNMHMCTVPGCGAMFSSRRSRNRHSKNMKNPKLHDPRARRLGIPSSSSPVDLDSLPQTATGMTPLSVSPALSFYDSRKQCVSSPATSVEGASKRKRTVPMRCASAGDEDVGEQVEGEVEDDMEDDMEDDEDMDTDEEEEMHQMDGLKVSLIQSKTDIGYINIPINRENPRQCYKCKKIFQNHFSVKTHYQNVHLKIPHPCTIDGCTKIFPSKRSRDRHSQNVNMHKEILHSVSTSKPHLAHRDCTPVPLRSTLTSPPVVASPPYWPAVNLLYNSALMANPQRAATNQLLLTQLYLQTLQQQQVRRAMAASPVVTHAAEPTRNTPPRSPDSSEPLNLSVVKPASETQREAL